MGSAFCSSATQMQQIFFHQFLSVLPALISLALHVSIALLEHTPIKDHIHVLNAFLDTSPSRNNLSGTFARPTYPPNTCSLKGSTEYTPCPSVCQFLREARLVHASLLYDQSYL